MADTHEAETRHALDGARKRALRGVVRAGDELLVVHVLLTRPAQRLEGRGLAAALAEAMAAEAERMRTRAETTGGERVLAGQRERLAQVTADVLPDVERVELMLRHGVQDTTGLFGALGGVLRQIARDLAALALVKAAYV